MNIVPMTDELVFYPVCGQNNGGQPIGWNKRACQHECVRLGLTEFIDMSRMDTKDIPHCHVTCDTCHFQFLVTPHDAETLVKLL